MSIDREEDGALTLSTSTDRADDGGLAISLALNLPIVRSLVLVLTIGDKKYIRLVYTYYRLLNVNTYFIR